MNFSSIVFEWHCAV